MTPWLDDGDIRLFHGDALETVRAMPDESVDCVVTSPPYWGLRDYGTGEWDGGNPDCDHRAPPQGGPVSGPLVGTGHREQGKDVGYKDLCGKCGARRVDRQMGLEPTPDLFVAGMVELFREIRRVLAPHGTCWVNLGDSYAANRSYQVSDSKHQAHDFGGSNAQAVPDGLKPKDLVGIPWAVAKALQEPYYGGRIARERDRVWLAATIDAEGSICGFTHERADGDGTRTGIHITITNTSMPMLAEAQRIWPTSRDDGNGHGVSALGTRECRRWIAHNVDDKAALLAELYPYLIAKRTQALLAWNFLQMSREAKRIGKTAEGAKAKERRAWIVAALSDLNHGREVDVPSWIEEPHSLYEPGWYLRSDVIWAKPNPMPESVTDRPTKAHEYVFLLTKSPRYWFDTEAVREPLLPSSVARGEYGHASFGKGQFNGSPSDERHQEGKQVRKVADLQNPAGRNVRSVWQIATQPYPEAHFATFPEELARRCILAGCPTRVCRVCGKPSERIVEHGADPNYIPNHEREAHGMTQPGNAQVKHGSFGAGRPREVVGWSDCGHNDWRTGQVLDPFIGSGTVAKVARDHQRHAIGIDLNHEYLELAARRLQQLSLLT